MNPDDRINQMTELTQILTGRLVKECKDFEDNKPLEAAKTLDETTRLANMYRHESQRLREASHLLKEATVGARLNLIKATEAFDAVLARHGRAVESAKIITEGLVRAIAEEVASSRPTGAGYGPGAQSAMARATALTLNRSA